jgi:ketosteroid isomerase-like protein
MTPSDEFGGMIDKVIAAMKRLVSGDAEPYQLLWSRREDVTVLGGFGGYALGWEQVSENTRFAAARFGGAKSFEVKMLSSGMSGELAYTVWIEHGEVRLAGREEYAPIVVRVTHIFRLEEGVWKIIHRHGDAVVEKTEAMAILQR